MSLPSHSGLYRNHISYDQVDTKNNDVRDAYQQWPLPWLLPSYIHLWQGLQGKTQKTQAENSTLFKCKTIAPCKHIIHACSDIHMYTQYLYPLWASTFSTASCTQLHSHIQHSQVAHTVTCNKTGSTCTRVHTRAVASVTVNSRLLRQRSHYGRNGSNGHSDGYIT